MASTIPPTEAKKCYSAVAVGSKLFVAGSNSVKRKGSFIFQYDTERNVWEKLSHSCGEINTLCVIDDYMYPISTNLNRVPQRFNFAKRQWQSIASGGTRSSDHCPKNGAIVHSKVFVLYENRSLLLSGRWSSAELNCFDPVKNEWEVKATTCQLHFGSSLLVVNNTLYVAGGYDSMSLDVTSTEDRYTILDGNPAPVEM